MADNFRILGISGSLRAASFNTALIRAAIDVGRQHGLEISQYPIGDLPYYDGDTESQGDPPEVTRLKEASPEYNHSVSAVLKNAIDWAARNPSGGGVAFAPLARKPIAIMGAGGRAGTARSQVHLRQILAETRSYTMVHPSLLVDRPRDRLVDGKWDEETTKGLNALLAGLHDWVAQFSG